ncbi:MAG: zinc-binding alcohol dehydrogenase family protein [Burkholderiales bacterium]|jgi:NADPH2:quinone reductase
MTASPPDTMNAAIRGQTGLEFARIARPMPGADDVLIRVRAVALNRADLGVLAGHMHGNLGGPGTVLGMEWAGDVVEVGERVTGHVPGDRVMGFGAGAFAEYTVSDRGRVLPIPADMDYAQAATLPVALLTMHDALVTNGRLRRGESVLVQGASSGVGLMAMRIARHLGAQTVIGSSTDPERRARLHEFGATLAIDTSDTGWPARVLDATGGQGVDLVVDQLSGATVNGSLAATKVLGRIVNVGRLAGMKAEFDFDLHALRRIQYIGVTFRTRSVDEVREIRRRMWDELAPAVSDGTLSLPISTTFPFERLGDAFATMKANLHFGKIVVTVA